MNRKFILIEDSQDIARNLLQKRLNNVIKGKCFCKKQPCEKEKHEPTGGGFTYKKLTKEIDWDGVKKWQENWEKWEKEAECLAKKIEKQNMKKKIRKEVIIDGQTYLFWNRFYWKEIEKIVCDCGRKLINYDKFRKAKGSLVKIEYAKTCPECFLAYGKE